MKRWIATCAAAVAKLLSARLSSKRTTEAAVGALSAYRRAAGSVLSQQALIAIRPRDHRAFHPHQSYVSSSNCHCDDLAAARAIAHATVFGAFGWSAVVGA